MNVFASICAGVVVVAIVSLVRAIWRGVRVLERALAMITDHERRILILEQQHLPPVQARKGHIP